MGYKFTHSQSKKQFQKTMRLNNLNTILSSEINLLSIRQRGRQSWNIYVKYWKVYWNQDFSGELRNDSVISQKWLKNVTSCLLQQHSLSSSTFLQIWRHYSFQWTPQLKRKGKFIQYLGNFKRLTESELKYYLRGQL